MLTCWCLADLMSGFSVHPVFCPNLFFFFFFILNIPVITLEMNDQKVEIDLHSQKHWKHAPLSEWHLHACMQEDVIHRGELERFI